MQGQAASFRGRGDDLSVAIASLEPFAARGRTTRCASSTASAGRRSGSCATAARSSSALSRAPGPAPRADRELRPGLRDDRRARPELARDLPDLPDLPARVAGDADCASTSSPRTPTRWSVQLRPAARELTPTLIDLGRLAPDLEAFFEGFDKTIAAGRTGCPRPASCSTRTCRRCSPASIPTCRTSTRSSRGSASTGARSPPSSATSPPRRRASRTSTATDQPLRFIRTVGPLGPGGALGLSAPAPGQPHQPLRRARRLREPAARGLRGPPLPRRPQPGDRRADPRPTPTPAAFPANLYENLRLFAWELRSDLVRQRDDTRTTSRRRPAPSRRPLASIGISPRTPSTCTCGSSRDPPLVRIGRRPT